MTIERLRKAARAEPFRPFVVSLADGRRFRVRHPECILITPKASPTFVVAEKGEDYSIIDLLLVTSLDYTNGQTTSHRRRRRRES